MKKILKRLIVIVLFFVNYKVSSQPFISNKAGYVSSPGFKSLAKSRGYSLIGAFEEVKENSSIKYAKVLSADGKWIMIDNSMNKVQNNSDKAVYEKKGLKGDNNSELNSGRLDYVDPSNVDLKIIKENDLYGLVNRKTNITIIPPVYNNIWLSEFNFVMVERGGKWGVISKQGKEVLPVQYDGLKSLGNFVQGRKGLVGEAVIVEKDGKWGLLSPEGKEVLKPEFEEIQSSWDVRSLVIINNNGLWGLANKKGLILLEPKYSSIQRFNKNGLATTYLNKGSARFYGVVDSTGKEIAKPIYDEVRYLSDSIISLQKGTYTDKTSQLIDFKGDMLTSKIYRSVGYFKNNIAQIYINDNNKKKVGYIDAKGNEVIKPIYDEILEYNCTAPFIVQLDNKYGLINIKQDYLIPLIYDNIKESRNKLYSKFLYIVTKENKKGIVSPGNKLLVPIKYEEIEDLVDVVGIFKVKLDNKYYLIDLYNNQSMIK